MKNIILIIALLIISSCNDSEILVPKFTLYVEDLVYLTDSTLLVFVTKDNIDEIIKDINDVEFEIINNNDSQLAEKATIKWIINEKDQQIGDINKELNLDSLSLLRDVLMEIESNSVKFKKNEYLYWRISFKKYSNNSETLIR
ncbi:MAG: hypothetical protein CVV25_10540 [Ignavibacteriae bacterium HGW-Ignavibacteriae-4]|jgi:hypothetical protein|nr:MAG: hypothetical protein CVV25_10540 [Ignavibacteriae bacterium HGW-Ignavibacteriae-4]